MSEPTLEEIEKEAVEAWVIQYKQHLTSWMTSENYQEGFKDGYLAGWRKGQERVRELEACRRVDREMIDHLSGKVNELQEGIKSVSEYQTPYQLEQLKQLIEDK
jgi:flagellar biosynthesis/type III secretory pathway protein FliH